MRNIFTVDIAQDLWSMVLCLFGIYWIMPKRVVDLLACWKGNCGRQQRSKVSTTRIMNNSTPMKANMIDIGSSKKKDFDSLIESYLSHYFVIPNNFNDEEQRKDIPLSSLFPIKKKKKEKEKKNGISSKI